MRDVTAVGPRSRVRLARLPTAGSPGEGSKDDLHDLKPRLAALHQRLWETGGGPVIVLLQGPDTAGKDSVIRHVFAGLIPQAMQVHAFGVPTPEEASHDFLWRYHQKLPRTGHIGVLNRTWYESVLVERVDRLAPEAVWQSRYDHINAFEAMLADSGAHLVKVMLHVSKAEQARRLKARRMTPLKAWKHNPDDLRKHRQYGAYEEAYDDLLARCSPRRARWHVVAADHKPSRDLAVARLLAGALEAAA
ncbi:MAG: hypothetical protein QOC71_656 [Thermoplasmata archaeon]|nr:hypothetical protein [Thermoplasmata archaeon]